MSSQTTQTETAKSLSEKLTENQNKFDSLMSEMTDTTVQYKLNPQDTSISNNYSNWKTNLTTLGKDMEDLEKKVQSNLDISNEKLQNWINRQLSSKNHLFGLMLPRLYQDKNSSYRMKKDNNELYKYQLLVNWEFFFGIVFILVFMFFYYKKYMNTAELVSMATQQINNAKQSLDEAKSEISQPSEETQSSE